ncbi:unnamed protein product [Urochloa humidicola]
MTPCILLRRPVRARRAGSRGRSPGLAADRITAVWRAPRPSKLLSIRPRGAADRVQHCIRARDGDGDGATQEVTTIEIRVQRHPRRPPPGHGEQQGILLGMGNPLVDISSILDEAFITITATAGVDVKDGHTPMQMRCAPRTILFSRMKRSMRILNEDEFQT